MRYLRAASTTGGSQEDWEEKVDVIDDIEGLEPGLNGLSLVAAGGRPLVAYIERANLMAPWQLYYCSSGTATGSSVADWGEPGLIDTNCDDFSLAAINNAPAVAYIKEGNLMYACFIQ
jgi:hypothetical protein